jgi:hypothetical protein
MLQDKIRLPYPWIKAKTQIDKLLYRLALAEDQEEAQTFLLRLYVENHNDLEFFDPLERGRVEGFLRFLIEDTRRHKEILTAIMEEVKAMGEVMHEQRTT